MHKTWINAGKLEYKDLFEPVRLLRRRGWGGSYQKCWLGIVRNSQKKFGAFVTCVHIFLLIHLTKLVSWVGLMLPPHIFIIPIYRTATYFQGYKISWILVHCICRLLSFIYCLKCWYSLAKPAASFIAWLCWTCFFAG